MGFVCAHYCRTIGKCNRLIISKIISELFWAWKGETSVDPGTGKLLKHRTEGGGLRFAHATCDTLCLPRN